MTKFWLLFFFWGTILISCNKEHLQSNGSIEFTIKKPTPNQVFNKNEKITFEFVAIGESEFHGYEYRILQLPSKNQLKIQNEHVHEKKLENSFEWSAPDTGGFQFEVKLFLDHNDNVKIDTVNFFVQ